MPNLKEVRTRIASVASTQQITGAMKMVSASKLRKAQLAILKLRPYTFKLREILQSIMISIDDTIESIYTKERPIQKVLLIVIASNRGLCGAFNSNIIKATNKLIITKYDEQHKNKKLDLMCFGKRLTDFYSKRGYSIAANHNQIFDNLQFSNVYPIAEKIMKQFSNNEYDKIEIIYNQFKNAAVQVLSIEQFLPILPNKTTTTKNKLNATNYIFEPSKEEIINELIPKLLKVQLYKALLDSYASEHGARMTAMHKATDNAQEMLKELRLSYNKARQAAITKEILEIVSGAEALKG